MPQESGIIGGLNEPMQTGDQQHPSIDLILGEDGIPEPDFPHAKLAMLEEKISSPRWVVPVLPEQELEVLLNASIDLCRKGILNYQFTLNSYGVI